MKKKIQGILLLSSTVIAQYGKDQTGDSKRDF
jgi:lysosomal acid lipase/cholesteryl ester hydrolase